MILGASSPSPKRWILRRRARFYTYASVNRSATTAFPRLPAAWQGRRVHPDGEPHRLSLSFYRTPARSWLALFSAPDALTIVGRGGHLVQQRFAFRDGRANVAMEVRVDLLARHPQGRRRKRMGEGARVLINRRQKLFRLDNAMDKPECECFLREEHPARKQELLRPRETDEPRQEP